MAAPAIPASTRADVLKHLPINRQVRNNLLQLGILIFKLLQRPHLRTLDPQMGYLLGGLALCCLMTGDDTPAGGTLDSPENGAGPAMVGDYLP
jgi:hypothetical protein